ncbi:MAG: TIGR03618 family F420-dependent PPOX class oxidoreductase [Candidatus Limnocylindrales bacterium]
MAPHAAQALIPPEVRRFLEEPGHFAVVATLNPDGSVHQAVAWYLLDGDTLILNSRVGRRWPTNLRRDPRVSVAVADAYRWVSLRGRVQAIEEQGRAQADIAAMARRYHAGDPVAAERQVQVFQQEARVSFVLRPTRVTAHLDEE